MIEKYPLCACLTLTLGPHCNERTIFNACVCKVTFKHPQISYAMFRSPKTTFENPPPLRLPQNGGKEGTKLNQIVTYFLHRAACKGETKERKTLLKVATIFCPWAALHSARTNLFDKNATIARSNHGKTPKLTSISSLRYLFHDH